MRLLLDAKRTEQGYQGADVFVGPSRTEEAYVAAVLALHGQEMEREGTKRTARATKWHKQARLSFSSNSCVRTALTERGETLCIKQ